MIKSIFEEPRVRAAMLSAGFPALWKPIFIITGIMVARVLSVKRECKKKTNLDAELSLRVADALGLGFDSVCKIISTL